MYISCPNADVSVANVYQEKSVWKQNVIKSWI